MTQYISKSALVADIEKRQKEEVFYDEDGSFASWADQNHYSTLESIKNFINTFETKEVDLEEEIDKIWNPRFNLGWDEKSLLSMNHEGFTTIAKYFFELGLKAKGE